MIIKVLVWCSIVVQYQLSLVTGQNFINTDKTLYEYNDPIKINWDYTNVYDADLIGVYNPTGITTLDPIMWVWTKTLTQVYEYGTRPTGSVTFDGMNPDEHGSQTWPLAPGNYKIYITSLFAPYTPKVSTQWFTVREKSKNIIDVSKVQHQYAVNEPIHIFWDYPEPKVGDWIGIYPSYITSFGYQYILWVYIASKTQTPTNLIGSKKGLVSFNSDPPYEGIWPLRVGSYKVHILRNVGWPAPSFPVVCRA
jgi:hypothetical protein